MAYTYTFPKFNTRNEHKQVCHADDMNKNFTHVLSVNKSVSSNPDNECIIPLVCEGKQLTTTLST